MVKPRSSMGESYSLVRRDGNLVGRAGQFTVVFGHERLSLVGMLIQIMSLFWWICRTEKALPPMLLLVKRRQRWNLGMVRQYSQPKYVAKVTMVQRRNEKSRPSEPITSQLVRKSCGMLIC